MGPILNSALAQIGSAPLEYSHYGSSQSVTQRSTYGSRKVSTLKRSHPSGHLYEQPENEQSQSPSTAFETSVVLNDEEEEGLTEHRLGCISSISRWSEMREDLRKTVTENAALPINQLFILSQGEGLSAVSKVWTAFFFLQLLLRKMACLHKIFSCSREVGGKNIFSYRLRGMSNLFLEKLTSL